MAKSCKFGWSVHKLSFITRNWVNFPKYDWIYRTFSYLFVKCFSEKFSSGTVCFGGIQQRIPSQCFWEGFVCQWVGLTLTRVILGRAIILEFSKPEDRNCVFLWEDQCTQWSSFVSLCGVCLYVYYCYILQPKMIAESIVSPEVTPV